MRLLAMGLVAFAIFAQDPTQQIDDKLAAVRLPLVPEAVESALEARSALLGRRLVPPRSQVEIDRARPELRRRLIDSLGYRLLPWPPDLRATLLATSSHTGYRVEKIAYQTLKDVLVTAHVYVPDATSPAPAVLFLGGHWWKEGKAHPDAQAFGINMARLGFIVMIPDPLGTGDRGPSEKDHRHPEALLAALSQPGIAEYETQCALDYLLNRKDVDAKRIGLTGVDGGGFNTWITAALDDRIAAAVPVEDTFDFVDRIHAMRASDWNKAEDQCELVPGILQYANIQELIAMAAPKPMMIIAGPEVRHIQEAATPVARLRFFEDTSTGYSKHRREGAYAFFLQVLMRKGDGARIEEPQTDIAAYENTVQTSSDAGIAGALEELARAAKAVIDPRTYLQIPPEHGQFTLHINPHPVIRANTVSEQGLRTPVSIFRPGGEYLGGMGAALIVIDDRDKESVMSDPIVQEAMKRDYMIVEMDPRGFGEIAFQRPGWVFATSLLLGENVAWRQAWDIQFWLLSYPTRRYAIYARGPKASLAAAYAVWLFNSDNLAWTVLRGSFTSHRQLFDHAAELPPEMFPFGALQSTDIPQLVTNGKTQTYFIDPSGPADGLRLTSAEKFVDLDW